MEDPYKKNPTPLNIIIDMKPEVQAQQARQAAAHGLGRVSLQFATSYPHRQEPGPSLLDARSYSRFGLDSENLPRVGLFTKSGVHWPPSLSTTRRNAARVAQEIPCQAGSPPDCTDAVPMGFFRDHAE